MTLLSLPFGAALLLALAGCQRPPPSPQSALVRDTCRETVDRQYLAQNRADLTRRDERDAAFSAAYDPGISSRGLGAAFGREQAIDTCLRANGARPGAVPATGPAFAPERDFGNNSSLTP